MLKRQDSLVASAARQQTPAPESHHHVVIIKSTGCMSGIIQLISKYQKKTKRLTSGRKQGKNSSPTRVVVVVEHEKDHLKVARSPKIQPDIRRKTQENVKKEAAAALLSCPPNKSTELKRRKILHALEKCNDDLESIRKIINSLKRVSQIDDDATPSPFLCNYFHNGHNITQQRKPVRRIKRLLGAYEAVDKFTNNAPLLVHMKPVATTSCSKAMIQSVEEVCNETTWGQKREAGRIGVMLQDHICRDLIEELVKEMDLLCLRSLPFIACKKRLFF